MNTNYYLNKLSERVFEIEKRLSIIEGLLINKDIKPMSDEERQRSIERDKINS